MYLRCAERAAFKDMIRAGERQVKIVKFVGPLVSWDDVFRQRRKSDQLGKVFRSEYVRSCRKPIQGWSSRQLGRAACQNR
jgi:hypothetical protein